MTGCLLRGWFLPGQAPESPNHLSDPGADVQKADHGYQVGVEHEAASMVIHLEAADSGHECLW
jgi:hypothetical protein